MRAPHWQAGAKFPDPAQAKQGTLPEPPNATTRALFVDEVETFKSQSRWQRFVFFDRPQERDHEHERKPRGSQRICRVANEAWAMPTHCCSRLCTRNKCQ